MSYPNFKKLFVSCASAKWTKVNAFGKKIYPALKKAKFKGPKPKIEVESKIQKLWSKTIILATLSTSSVPYYAYAKNRASKT